jgi:phage tail-like protein
MSGERRHAVTTCNVEQPGSLVLNKRSAWEQGLSINLEIMEGGISLKKVFEYAIEREIELEQITQGFEVTDFAVGECSLIYILDSPSRAIWIYDPNQNRFEQIECIESLFSHPTSIAFAPGTLFIGDDEAESRLMALAEINWQIRWDATDSKDNTGKPLELPNGFEPIDLAAGDDGNLYALDKANLLILQFDKAGRLRKTSGSAQLAGKKPAAIALSQDGAIYVLELQEKKILKIHTGNNPSDGAFIDFQELIASGLLPAEFSPFGLAVDRAGNLYVGDHRDALPNEEDDRFIRKFRPVPDEPDKGEYVGEVPAYRGSVESLTVDKEDRIYIFNKEGQEKKNKIIPLKLEQNYAKLKASPLIKGSYFSRSFDSAMMGTIWHKLVLDATTPENTQIQVSHLTADEKRFFIGGESKELDDFLAEAASLGDDEKEKSIAKLDKLDWSVALANPKDALINNTPGRYLWLKIDLIGSEDQSPTLSTARVVFPRTSYLRYLPAIYQQQERSRDFLERFLSIFETLLGGLESDISQVVRYFDADASVTEGDFLRWLASWFAISVDNNWDDERVRALIKRAPSLYKKRGTREGLEEMIEIYTGGKPIIVEWFQWKRCLKGVEEAPSTSEPPLRRCSRVITSADTGEPLVRFERVVQAYIERGASAKVKVIITPLAEIEAIKVEEILPAGFKLKSGSLSFTYSQSEIKAAGGQVTRAYEILAPSNQSGAQTSVQTSGQAGSTSIKSGSIKGTIKIKHGPRQISEPLDSVVSTMIVRPGFDEILVGLYGSDPYCFCVLLDSARVKSESERATVRRIIDSEKPAHTCAGMRVLQPWIQLDSHTYLEVNTLLSKPSLRLDFGASLPHDTVLTDIEEAAQLETHARLDIDTTLG